MKRHIFDVGAEKRYRNVTGIETTPWTNRDHQCSLKDMQGNGSIVLRRALI
jgi:hypothetical protein